MPRRIRKQVDKLTASDFELHSCWVYASDEEGSDGQDECTVRPLKLEELQAETSQVFVQAAFLFPNGRIRSGVVTLNNGEGASGHQPAVFLATGAVYFYHGATEPKAGALKAFYRSLRTVCPQPFPITYVSALRTEDGLPLASGHLSGLYWLENWRTGKLRAARLEA
jgi:hypothetical protein